MSIRLLFGILITLCIALACAGCVSQPAPQTTTTLVTPTVTAIPTPVANTSDQTFLSIPQTPLNASERQDVLYLQESEKLEHDLYAKFAQQYTSVPIFASLEQATVPFMKVDDIILVRYGLTDPEKPTVGSFTSPALQNLYVNYMNTGSMSVLAALNSAAKSEDMHIADLQAAISRTDNEDVKFIYRQQLAFSQNNLRALVQWIKAFGGTYVPTYITPAYYSSIINSPVEPIPTI
jgi:hypothetical protein